MESLGNILRARAAPTNTSAANTDISSDAKVAPEPQPACPWCKGAGFVYAKVPAGHPDFGKAIPCRCTQKEMKKERRVILERYSNLGPLVRLTFDNLIPQGRRGDAPSQERFGRAYQAAKAFAQEPKGWLVFLGPSGCGKTHLAAAIANYRLSLEQPVFFCVVPDLLDHLRSTFAPASQVTYDELFEQVRSAPLLILDDLGTQSSTPWAQEKLFQIINHRCNSQLPTVVTSNVSLEELDERLRTRLSDPNLSQVYLVEQKQDTGLEQIGGLPELAKSMTFDNFDWKRRNLAPEQRQNLELAFRLAYDYARSPEGWLIFQGVNGCGKTHLAAAIANFSQQAGKPVLFLIVAELLDHLRAAFSPESKVTYDELFERVKKAPLIILDDFGEQSSTPWAKEKLYQLINYRYNGRLPTVITTCLSLEEIETRISSRMVDPRLSVVFNIIAPDYRGDSSAEAKSRLTLKRSKRMPYSHRGD